MKTKKTYIQRVEQLISAIEIAENILISSETLEDYKIPIINGNKELKNLALHPEPQFKNIQSLKFLEHAFLTYWNESEGQHIEKFWMKIYKAEMDYERKDSIYAALKRKKIKDIHEYDDIKDNLVLYIQMGRISEEQANLLDQLLHDFDQNRVH